MEYISIDKDYLDKLRKAYLRAYDSGQDYITIDGREYYVRYLKYLIEYAEMMLKNSKC